MRQIPDRAEVCVELETLAQFDVDAGKSAADRGGYRTFQAHTRALDRVVECFRDVFLVFFVRLSAGFETLPFELDAGCFENTNGGAGNFGADAVTGNEGDFVCHSSLADLFVGYWLTA